MILRYIESLMAESIKKKSVKGVAWSGIDNAMRFSVSFVMSVVLARLLSPDDYGLIIGFVNFFTIICETLTGGFTTFFI